MSSNSNNFAHLPSLLLLPIPLLLLPLILLHPSIGQPLYGGQLGIGTGAFGSPYGAAALSRYSLGNPYISQYPFYGKPSYGYVSPYGGGYGMSGYEGPPYGMNTYWQPGVAYPPSIYGQGYGSAASLGCRDRSVDCAVLASSGQCASSASTRALCPLSCGLGCGGADLYGAGAGAGIDPFYRGIPPPPPGGPPNSTPLFPTPLGLGQSATTFLPDNAPFGPQFGGGTNGFPAAAGGAGLVGAGGSLFDQPPFYCRDSHIFGCPQWAQQGFCQSVPEFMLNYCRASCGICNANGGGGPGPFGGIGTLGGPMESLMMGGGGGGGFGGPVPTTAFSMDQLGGGGGILPPDQLAGPAQLLGGASSLGAGLYSPYFPYSQYYNPLLHTSAASALGVERKEKQQRNGGTKLMFSEDEDGQLFSAGLSNALANSQTGAAISSPSSASSSSALFNPGLPASSLSTQHSSVSKLVRMDDLLMDTKKQRKSRR